MSEELFRLRPAARADIVYLDSYAAAEGMDAIGSPDQVTVAVNEDDVPVGFLRLQEGAGGVWHVNPVVVCAPWRRFGVGKALVARALSAKGELRLVARGSSVPFYSSLGFGCIEWADIAAEVAGECDGCELREECCPIPMGIRISSEERMGHELG